MSLQVPPLTQGFDSHSLLLTSQLAPPQPGSQSHLYLQRDQAAQGRQRWAFPAPTRSWSHGVEAAIPSDPQSFEVGHQHPPALAVWP